MASAFNICALAQSWVISIPPKTTVEHGVPINDPSWLIAVNALSLVSAVVANLTLLLRLARRVPFHIANPFMIIGWYLSSILLVAIVAATPSTLQRSSPSRHDFSQAYYYAIMAATLYFIIASLIAITVYKSCKGHHTEEFQLTNSQRTLMLQTITFFFYLLGGAGVYSRVEKWAFADAVYWADFTLLTVGLGSPSPTTHLGRSLLFPYAVGGVVSLGLLVSSIRSMVLQTGEQRIAREILEAERKNMISRVEAGKVEIPATSDAKDRRREEFSLMRKVQKRATQKRIWAFFLLATMAWFLLWILGAVVFWAAERNQHWTYFESLYFAFVSLLSIEYGTFFPQSNPGKPFYVFWSLLAVPTLTILISSLEDTVAKSIKDLILLIGEFTVLPSGGGPLDGLRGSSKRSMHVKGKARSSNLQADTSDDASNHQNWECLDAEPDRLSGAGHRNIDIIIDKIHHSVLLATEIRNLMDDLGASPPKQYTYEEWERFLKLLGRNTSKATFPRNLSSQVLDDPHAQLTEGDDGDGQWSWLGSQNALVAKKEEAATVLESLCLTLLEELHDVAETSGVYNRD